jgi:predicted phosphodiesterase
MSLSTPQFQIASDLHLETPLTTPHYDSFRMNVQADNVLLLGDIGRVVDDGLFKFLRRTLDENRGCRILYVLGNHEPYQTTYEHAYEKLRSFEQEAKSNFGGRFKFLCRDRYDVDETITILGCTLWSAIQEHQQLNIAARSKDLNSECGIQGWTLERHREEHEKDLSWLHDQVSMMENNEPHRQLVVATHYSPTIDSRASDPRHEGSSVSSNFVTDLSQEQCWRSPNVKLWAFGHTHYNCDYHDDMTVKLVVANQRGYAGLGAQRRGGMQVKIVEAREERWEVLERRKSDEELITAVAS